MNCCALLPQNTPTPRGRDVSDANLLKMRVGSWICVVWQADYFRPMSHNSKMENRSDRHILAAERLNVGVVITFDNGESAIYSAALLYSMFPQAHRVDESELIEQD
jgi:hypothetical protein